MTSILQKVVSQQGLWRYITIDNCSARIRNLGRTKYSKTVENIWRRKENSEDIDDDVNIEGIGVPEACYDMKRMRQKLGT